MVEIIFGNVLWGLLGAVGGFGAGYAVCQRRHRRKKTASTADSFLKLLRH